MKNSGRHYSADLQNICNIVGSKKLKILGKNVFVFSTLIANPSISGPVMLQFLEG